MTRTTRTAVGGFIAMMVFAASSIAQPACGKRAKIVERLKTGNEEHQNSAGIAANGNLVEIFASEKGNWSIISTQPGGLTCLMAVGQNWQNMDNPTKDRGHML